MTTFLAACIGYLMGYLIHRFFKYRRKVKSDLRAIDKATMPIAPPYGLNPHPGSQTALMASAIAQGTGVIPPRTPATATQKLMLAGMYGKSAMNPSTYIPPTYLPLTSDLGLKSTFVSTPYGWIDAEEKLPGTDSGFEDETRQVDGLEGLRIWRVAYDPDIHEPLLCSTMMMATAWRGPVMKADEPPVRPNWSKGIYTLKAHRRPVGFVWGVCELGGLTMIHEQGYRSEMVTIQSIMIPACFGCGRQANVLALATLGPDPLHCFDAEDGRHEIYPEGAEMLFCLSCSQKPRLLTGTHLTPVRSWPVNDVVTMWERRYQCDVRIEGSSPAETTAGHKQIRG